MSYVLVLKAELNNIAGWKVQDSPQQPFEYAFEIQCIDCRAIHPNHVTFNIYEKHQISDSAGEASFIHRCRDCKRSHNANIKLPKDNEYKLEDEEKILLHIDARGMYFLNFYPTEGSFQATGTTGTVFKDIDLSEGEWYDYDEDLSQEVSISDLSFEIKKSK